MILMMEMLKKMLNPLKERANIRKMFIILIIHIFIILDPAFIVLDLVFIILDPIFIILNPYLLF